jgi:hypothetical protein
MLLEKGRVPVEVATTVLSLYIKEADRDANMCLEVLAEKADIGYGTLEKWHFDGDRSKSVAFDVADRLMCAAGLGVLGWTRLFPEFYAHVDLHWKQCECPGCEVMFELPPMMEAICTAEGCSSPTKARGLCNAHYIAAKKDGVLDQFPHYYAGPIPKYCSEACRLSAYQQREGITTSRRKSYLMNRDEKCRNGHTRTEENTYYRKNGKRECRDCKRDTNRASYGRVRLAA